MGQDPGFFEKGASAYLISLTSSEWKNESKVWHIASIIPDISRQLKFPHIDSVDSVSSSSSMVPFITITLEWLSSPNN